MYNRRIALREQAEKAKQQNDLKRLQEDLRTSKGDKLIIDAKSRQQEQEEADEES